MMIRRSLRSPRWDFIGHYHVWLDGDLLLSRWRFLQTPLSAILLTRIYMRDNDRDAHNHSRSFVTICLTGSYDECLHDADDLTQQRHEHRHHRWLVPYYVSHKQPHHISHLYGKVRTLVLAGRHHGTFWFFTSEGPVDWKEYNLMAANCRAAGSCTCDCHYCRYDGHCSQHNTGCHLVCTPPPPGEKDQKRKK